MSGLGGGSGEVMGLQSNWCGGGKEMAGWWLFDLFDSGSNFDPGFNIKGVLGWWELGQKKGVLWLCCLWIGFVIV